MRSLLSFGIVLSALGVVLAASPVAYAQVDCSDPDNLCTGDPCVIPTVEVLSPCQVDFGARTVIIAGRLRISGYSFSLRLTAANFDVQGTISGINESPSYGADIFLTATSDIEVNGRVSIRGNSRASHVSAGDIFLRAQNDIVVRKPISISGRSRSGLMVLEAGGAIDIEGPIRSRARVGFGKVRLTAAGNISIRAPVKGAVFMNAGGNIDIERPVRAPDGDIVAEAQGVLTINAPVNGRGRSYAVDFHPLILRGASGVSVNRLVVGTERPSVEISSSAGSISINDRVLADGADADLTVSAFGDVDVNHLLRARGYQNQVTVASTTGNVTLNAGILGNRPSRVSSVSPDVTITAAGAVVVNERILNGALGGVIRIEGATIQTASGSKLDARGDRTGGEIRLTTTAGALTLSGSLLATGDDMGGIIEAASAADLTTDATFKCAPDGCIALSAGGTLDTTGGTFDVPLSPDCPGSPSGAFLDPSTAVLE